jgi:uncharacterized protein (DUF362 family)
LVQRREFLRKVGALATYSLTGCLHNPEEREGGEVEPFEELLTMPSERSKVYVIKTTDRKKGVAELLRFFDLDSLSGKKVAIKANFNSPDPYPATTHIDTLSIIVDALQQRSARVVLAERSGQGETERVLEEMGVYRFAVEKGIEVINLDELGSDGWIKQEGEHWIRGYLFAKVFNEADAVIQTCCLKTHRFGGHFTMSLKNSVGMIAKNDPSSVYNYMIELHAPLLHQREKIAEINRSYIPKVVIMDGIKGFSHGGPDKGTLIEPGILLASDDRIALDATGVAVLRIHGTTKEVEKGEIFQQSQIKRAADLGLGATGSEDVEIIPVNSEAEDICIGIEKKLSL